MSVAGKNAAAEEKKPGCCEDSTDSDNETERKSLLRRISTSKCVGRLPVVKEGYLMKQTRSFLRWQRRYFRLRGRTLYYAKEKECLEIIPERTYVTFENPKYVSDCRVQVRRYGRNSPYVVNFEGTTFHTWDKNISVHIAFFEYLHNEYKPSFIQMTFNLCDLINKDPYVGALFVPYLTCPLPAGYHKATNLSFLSVPAMNNFPFVFPFEKGKVTLRVTLIPENVLISEVDGYFRFIQTKFKSTTTSKSGK